MKKMLLGMIALTTISIANAQGLGVQAGVNFSNLSIKSDGEKLEDLKLKTGFQVGVNYDIAIGDDFYVQPGLNFIQNGTKGKENGQSAQLSLNYLQLPVTFQYKPKLGAGKLILAGGPYVAYGIGKAKEKIGGTTNNYNWDDNLMKKVDAGAKLVAGYQLSNGLSLNLNTDLGLLDISKDGEDYDYSAKNTAFGLTLGFRF